MCSYIVGFIPLFCHSQHDVVWIVAPNLFRCALHEVRRIFALFHLVVYWCSDWRAHSISHYDPIVEPIHVINHVATKKKLFEPVDCFVLKKGVVKNYVVLQVIGEPQSQEGACGYRLMCKCVFIFVSRRSCWTVGGSFLKASESGGRTGINGLVNQI